MSGKTGVFHKIRDMFDQRPNPVPMGRRLGAYVADWAIGGIISGMPAVLIYSGVTGRNDLFSNLYVFEALGFDAVWGILAGVLCIVFALIYYVYVPWKIYPGQTLGKKMLGLRIERTDGTLPSGKDLLLRQAFAIFLLEGSVYVISSYIHQLVTLLTRFYVDVWWQYAGVAITFVSVVLVIYTGSHRALHDYIGHTRVVSAPSPQKTKDPLPQAKPKPQQKAEKKAAGKKQQEPAAREQKHLPKKNKTKK